MSENLSILKNNVVTEMFVDTADQNYLIARWTYHRHLFLEFFWNAAQALEKYLKASLLLNGCSAIYNGNKKPYRHNLTLLFDEVRTYANDFFLEPLTRPAGLDRLIDTSHWHDETPAGFLERFSSLGDANNRYAVFGYTQRWEDLHHLDQMVYRIRRVAYPLDMSWPPGSIEKTVRERLERSPHFSPRSLGSRLYKTLESKEDDELRDAGLCLNFSFAPDYDHTKDGISIGTSSSTTVLYQRIIKRAESSKTLSDDQDVIDLADWVRNNIKLPPSVKKEIHDCARTLQTRKP